MLNKTENFNISEGNVKENNINVANNVAQRNSQDLTEQWKKGELEQGWYYANNDGERIIIYIFEKNGSVLGDDFDLKATDWIKPIAPVPSLEQWQQMKAFCEEFNALEVAEENQRLKELLDKASYYLIRYKNNDTLPERAFYEEEVSEFLDKIDEELKKN